jgi:hypothetical protein
LRRIELEDRSSAVDAPARERGARAIRLAISHSTRPLDLERHVELFCSSAHVLISRPYLVKRS